jgi:hypothetical protein
MPGGRALLLTRIGRWARLEPPFLRARSSVVERSAHNRLVTGSNPVGPTRPYLSTYELAISLFPLPLQNKEGFSCLERMVTQGWS